jgi:glycosyltransferase involved in cell wall biosynthesis
MNAVELRVLAVTNMWPTPGAPQFGVFVERQVNALRDAGVQVDVLFMNGRESQGNYLRGVAELRSRLRRSRYDLLHATYVFSGIVARTQLKHPIVLTHTGIEVLESWQAPLSWATSRLVDAVIVRSEEMRERLGLSDAAVIPAGVDLDLFRPQPQGEARAELGLPSGERIVLFVGEPRPEKRLDVVAQAVDILRAEDPHVRLVTVTGRSQADVALHLNAADVLALASTNEGSPGAVKEAMACNLPIVATDVGDVRRVIGTTEGCFLARGTAEDFADKLGRALARGQRTDGRQSIGWLSWPNVTRQVIDVYRSVLTDG